ncbi:MAG: aminopeptidase N, partial [Acidithiobacillus ferrooxidans]
MPEVNISGSKAAVIRRGDYQAPSYRVSEIALDVRLDPDNTEVHTRLQLHRIASEPVAELHLDGESLELLGLQRDGQALAESAYRLTEGGLLLLN